MFDDAQRAVADMKARAIGHPFAAAWWFPADNWCVESLFFYYLWPWFSLFGYSVITDEAASMALWCVTFLFTLLLTDLLCESYVVTSVVALVFTFLPFAFIYSFVAFNYGMTPTFAVMSLYFLNRGSNWSLVVGGIAAGLCLWSSVLGQQYIVALALCAPFYWRQWRKGLVVFAGFSVAAAPIVSYMIFHWTDYTYHASTRWNPTLDLTRIWDTFFVIPTHSYFLPDALLIPLPYYVLLITGAVVALWKKRFDIVLLATIPVAGVFVTGGPYVEHRLLMAIPFWIILIGFGVNVILNGGDALLIRHRIIRNAALTVRSAGAAIIIAMGLIPSAHYIYAKAKDPTSIHAFDPRRSITR
jgi:hypothetical protein